MSTTILPKQQNLITHRTNLIKDLGEEPLTIEVATYGLAIEMLTTKGSRHLDEIKKHQVTEADLLENITVVPSGIGHIVKMQLKGAVYIKA